MCVFCIFHMYHYIIEVSSNPIPTFKGVIWQLETQPLNWDKANQFNFTGTGTLLKHHPALPRVKHSHCLLRNEIRHKNKN